MIKESNTPVAAPVTVVVKKGREHRVCVDFRERNSRTECPIFPMPDVHDFLDDAAGFPLYCSFDCAKMFNQSIVIWLLLSPNKELMSPAEFYSDFKEDLNMQCVALDLP